MAWQLIIIPPAPSGWHKQLIRYEFSQALDKVITPRIGRIAPKM